MRKLELVGFLLIVVSMFGCSGGLIAGSNSSGGIMLTSIITEAVGSVVFLIGRFSR